MTNKRLNSFKVTIKDVKNLPSSKKMFINKFNSVTITTSIFKYKEKLYFVLFIVHYCFA